VKIIDCAMQMEKEAEKYYRELADQCADTHMAKILNMLADAEAQHGQTLQQLKKKQSVQLKESPLRDEIKNILSRLMDEDQEPEFSPAEADLFKRAQKMEQRNRDFYEEKAEECDAPSQAEVFYHLADEEELHYQILDSLIEFVSRPVPDNWLENADWPHNEDY